MDSVDSGDSEDEHPMFMEPRPKTLLTPAELHKLLLKVHASPSESLFIDEKPMSSAWSTTSTDSGRSTPRKHRRYGTKNQEPTELFPHRMSCNAALCSNADCGTQPISRGNVSASSQGLLVRGQGTPIPLEKYGRCVPTGRDHLQSAEPLSSGSVGSSSGSDEPYGVNVLLTAGSLDTHHQIEQQQVQSVHKPLLLYQMHVQQQYCQPEDQRQAHAEEMEQQVKHLSVCKDIYAKLYHRISNAIASRKRYQHLSEDPDSIDLDALQLPSSVVRRLALKEKFLQKLGRKPKSSQLSSTTAETAKAAAALAKRSLISL